MTDPQLSAMTDALADLILAKILTHPDVHHSIPEAKRKALQREIANFTTRAFLAANTQSQPQP